MKGHLSRCVTLLVAAVLILGSTVPLALGAEPARLDARLLDEFADAPGPIDFLVFLRDQADLSGAPALEDRVERGRYVYDSLRAFAEQGQARLRADLETWGADYHAFVIVNALRVTGDEALAWKLAARPEVERIVADPAFNGLDDPPPGPDGPPAIDGVEWNISRLNADDVWAQGYTGQNIVVGSCDTGVEWYHEALMDQYRGWDGGVPDHDYNWYDAFGEYTTPYDPGGHGTHTTGTMVGDDGDDDQIGMAPGAQWIACKVSSASGVWKASKYLECWEWFLAPTRVDGSDPDPAKAPHVINNSWSCPVSEGCDPDTLRDATQALYAAGIAIAKSGGNSGPGCSTITNPGQYPELLATAAFNSSDVIASFSSRGPVTIDGGIRIKPDIAAPGVSVRSASPGNTYSVSSGTSMAAPHTAGMIALLWSAQPDLIGDLETTYQILRSTAEPRIDLQCLPNGPGGRPNNVWGWGILDAQAAVQAALDTGLGTLAGVVTESAGGEPLPGVELRIAPSTYGPSRHELTGSDGSYDLALLAATYDVTATLYAYLPEIATGVPVISDTQTILDLSLDPAPAWTLSGTVTDADSGLPVQASLALQGTPVQLATDPETGLYDGVVAEGSYVLWAAGPGYLSQERAVVVDGDRVEDFALEPAEDYALQDSTMPCGPEFDWIDITSTGQPHALADDAFVQVSFGGLTFDYYDSTYSGVYISSNGYLAFGLGSSYPGGNTIPSTFIPNNAIFAFWDDLNPAGGGQGTIYSHLVDEHLFVIEFHEVEHWPSGSPETFEVILDLDNGTIVLQYLVVADSHWTSVGLENGDGSRGLSYAFHDAGRPSEMLRVELAPFSGSPPPMGPGEVRGVAADATTGDPIVGATVSAVSSGGEPFAFQTGAGGEYSGALCADTYTMMAEAGGYHPSGEVEIEMEVAGEVVQDFALDRIEADLWLAKTAPLTVTAGALLTYTLSFGSLGPDPVDTAEVRDWLPPEAAYAGSTGGTYSETLHTVIWPVTEVISGFHGAATVVVTVSETITDGWLVCNEAWFGATGAGALPDPDQDNDTDSACTEVEVPEGSYHLYLPLVLRGFGP